jgi:starvation-inducible outer membrane lipoprotein
MRNIIVLSALALAGCATTPDTLAENICRASKNCHVTPGPVYGPEQQRAIESDLSKRPR